MGGTIFAGDCSGYFPLMKLKATGLATGGSITPLEWLD